MCCRCTHGRHRTIARALDLRVLAGLWAEAHDRLVATIPPGFLLQENQHFDAQFKVFVVWGRYVP